MTKNNFDFKYAQIKTGLPSGRFFSYFYDQEGIIFASFSDDPIGAFKKFNSDPARFSFLSDSAIDKNLKKYFASGDRKYLDQIKINWDFWDFSAFRKNVLKELAKVDKKISYLNFSKKYKGAAWVRSTASAIAKNPFELFVPCHLVIKNDGKVGSYRDGTEIKRELLALEQNHATDQNW
ncbi:methylated-DNA--[protein]-cysteine S-methyltransferase [Oenococcus alcoholitolerans]|uniref:methylated-DNA--[protein]-cysteine S-methyltransferase n=1 Tax=Oenococcus alcoholitolerans TaxID=931074 RepID=UPI003F723FEE